MRKQNVTGHKMPLKNDSRQNDNSKNSSRQNGNKQAASRQNDFKINNN
jgi:hypothetical protein